MAAVEETISDFLARQEDELAKTFEALDKLADSNNAVGRRNLFDYLKQQLQAHMAVTEQLLYPSLEQDETLRAAIEESIATHEDMRVLLEELDQYINDLSVWQAGCKRLAQMFKQDSQMEREQILMHLPVDEQRGLVQQAHALASAAI